MQAATEGHRIKRCRRAPALHADLLPHGPQTTPLLLPKATLAVACNTVAHLPAEQVAGAAGALLQELRRRFLAGESLVELAVRQQAVTASALLC